MKRAIMRPAFLSLALLGALAFASHAQDREATNDQAPPTEPAAKPDKETAGKEGQAPDFSGKYLAAGVSNVGKPYQAMVEITRDKDVYQVIWVLGPREGYSGVGVVEGDALCVGWAIGEVPGVVIYKRGAKGDGKQLRGRWTAPGSQGKTYNETLTQLP